MMHLLNKTQDSKAFRVIVAVLLAVSLTVTVIPAHYAVADEPETSNITLKLDGDANITVESDQGTQTLDSNNREIQLTLNVGTYAHLSGAFDSSTNIGVITRDTHDSFDVDYPESFKDTSSFEYDVTASGVEKVVTISVNKAAEELPENESAAIAAMSIEPRSSSEPYIGEVFTGGFSVLALNQPGGPGHTVLDLTVGNATGILAEKGNMTLYCANHGMADPNVGAWYNYTATVTDINYDTGEVALSISATGTGEFTHADGYQNFTGSTSIHRDFGGWIDLQKVSANTDITNGNDCYSLEGAEYGIYSNEECTNQVGTLTTNADGYAKSDKLDRATYYVKEITAPQGYAIDETVYAASVYNNQTTHVNGGSVADIPQNDPAGIILGKFDGEYEYIGESNLPQGAASLAGAEFTVTYYDGQYSTAEEAGYKAANDAGEYTRQWVFATDSDGAILLSFAEDYFVSGDPLYYSQDGYATLPLGTFVVQETKAPDGYNLNNEIFIRNVTSDDPIDESVSTYNTPEVPDIVKRGDLEFSKRDAESMERLVNVPFRITSTTTGESHIVFTDENGYFSSSADYNAHTNDTNGNDDAYTAENEYVAENYNAEAGIWFGMNANEETTTPDDSLGALPYDTYTITELPCESNEGLQLVSTQITISRNATTVDLGTIDDPSMYISTVATDADDGDKYIVADNNSVFRDTVSYSGMIKDKQGVMRTTLVDLDDDNKELFVSETPFTSEGSGTVTVDIPFNTLGLDYHQIGIKEECIIDGRVTATHNENLDESEQIVTVIPEEITTQANDPVDGDQVVVGLSETTVNDRVDHKGHLSGASYTAYGLVMDKDTKLPFIAGPDADTIDTTKLEQMYTELQAAFGLEENGDKTVDLEAAQAVLDNYPDLASHLVYNKIDFTPEDYNGSVSMDFTFNALGMGGKNCVIFQIDVRDGKVVAQETDFESETESFSIVNPEIQTHAFDGSDGDKQVITSTTSSLSDTIDGVNFIKGLEYEVRTIAMDKETKEPALSNDQPITDTSTFTANESTVSVTVDIEADTTQLAGHQIVFYEEVYLDGELISEHKDINSEEQTVSIISPEQGETFDKTGGDNTLIYVVVGMMAALGLLGCGYAAYRHKKDSSEVSEGQLMPQFNNDIPKYVPPTRVNQNDAGGDTSALPIIEVKNLYTPPVDSNQSQTESRSPVEDPNNGKTSKNEAPVFSSSEDDVDEEMVMAIAKPDSKKIIFIGIGIVLIAILAIGIGYVTMSGVLQTQQNSTNMAPAASFDSTSMSENQSRNQDNSTSATFDGTTTLPSQESVNQATCNHQFEREWVQEDVAATTESKWVDPVYGTHTVYHTICNTCQEKVDGKTTAHRNATGHTSFTPNVPFDESYEVTPGHNEDVTVPGYSQLVSNKEICSICGLEQEVEEIIQRIDE